MLELGRFTEQAHRAVGEKTAKIADLIFTFGGRAKFIADEAGERGFEKNKIFSYLVQEDLIKSSYRLVRSRTRPSQGRNSGSNPDGSVKANKKMSRFYLLIYLLCLLFTLLTYLKDVIFSFIRGTDAKQILP